MRDYADQINSLRLCAESDDPVDECCWENCNQHHGSRDSMCRQKIMMDAADAIEELVAQRDGLLASAIELMHREDLGKWFVRHNCDTPVVHCEDCDLWNRWDSTGYEDLGNFACSCARWTVEDGVTFFTKPTDFCSYGERSAADDD